MLVLSSLQSVLSAFAFCDLQVPQRLRCATVQASSVTLAPAPRPFHVAFERFLESQLPAVAGESNQAQTRSTYQAERTRGGSARVTLHRHCHHTAQQLRCGRFLSLVSNLEHPKEQNSDGAIRASVSSLT